MASIQCKKKKTRVSWKTTCSRVSRISRLATTSSLTQPSSVAIASSSAIWLRSVQMSAAALTVFFAAKTPMIHLNVTPSCASNVIKLAIRLANAQTPTSWSAYLVAKSATSRTVVSRSGLAVQVTMICSKITRDTAANMSLKLASISAASSVETLATWNAQRALRANARN